MPSCLTDYWIGHWLTLGWGGCQRSHEFIAQLWILSLYWSHCWFPALALEEVSNQSGIKVIHQPAQLFAPIWSSTVPPQSFVSHETWSAFYPLPIPKCPPLLLPRVLFSSTYPKCSDSPRQLDQLLHTEQISPASRTESTLSLLSIFDWHMPTLLPSPTSPHHHALRTQTLSLKKRALSMHFRCRLNKWTWRENTALCRLKNFWPGPKVPKFPQPKPESHIHCSRYCVFSL